jgi:hypothetical protein
MCPPGTNGWYLGPALNHYQCYCVFTTKTKAEQAINTVEFFPQHTKVPYQLPTDVVAIKALTDAEPIISDDEVGKVCQAFGRILVLLDNCFACTNTEREGVSNEVMTKLMI